MSKFIDKQLHIIICVSTFVGEVGTAVLMSL